MGKKYRILESNDEEFSLKPATFGTYKRIKLAQYRCSAFDEASKIAIKKEFALADPEEDEKITLEELFEIYVKELFFDAPGDFKIEDVRLDEVNRAIQDFFQTVAGNLGG